jgi:hypothetical protein
VPQIDFITALGRLLRDGSLRDAYAARPLQTVENLGVQDSDRPALLALNVRDLEFQAQILLRKRFEALSCLIPQTCSNLGAGAWPLFAQYERSSPPALVPADILDAGRFLECIRQRNPAAISHSENNRVRFAQGTMRLSLHFVSDVIVRDHPRRCLQFFIRTDLLRWKEYVFYFAF